MIRSRSVAGCRPPLRCDRTASKLRGMNAGASIFFHGPHIAQRGDATRSDLTAIRRYQRIHEQEVRQRGLWGTEWNDLLVLSHPVFDNGTAPAALLCCQPLPMGVCISCKHKARREPLFPRRE